MSSILEFLDGKKTYLGILAGVVYMVLIQYAGVADNAMIWTAIAGWTGVSLRQAVK